MRESSTKIDGIPVEKVYMPANANNGANKERAP